MSAPAIGIDLGTTNSCVAIYLNGKVEVLANNVGERTTPSYVVFKNKDVLVGKIAKDLAYRNSKNSIFEVKRLMGKKYDDDQVQEEIQNWPFTVTCRNGNPEFQVEFRGINCFFSPEQISAEILKNLRDVASKRVDAPVTKAVITIPAYFNDSQRQATLNAGKLAGLEVLMLLNEPTAAAITYALDRNSKNCKHALVFDLGGGTFDVSIIKYANQHITIKAVDGDSHLGGVDFDRKLLDYCLDDIQKRFNYDIRSYPVAMARLIAQCEQKKQMLSFCTETEIEIFGLFHGEDYFIELTRKQFEELNMKLFDRTLEIVKRCIMAASLTPSDINNVVLVGGSTKIPQIKYLLSKFFKGTPLSETVNPDEAVAFGAAIQAAKLSNHKLQTVEDYILEDVVTFSLGIEVVNIPTMSTIIKRNTLLPVTATEKFTTVYDKQTEVVISVYEGENDVACENHLLGSFVLTNIPPAPRGVPEILVTFDIDINGILNVTATETSSNESNNIIITIDRSRLSKDKLQKMIN